jgi:GT2 family glycosyltransferase
MSLERAAGADAAANEPRARSLLRAAWLADDVLLLACGSPARCGGDVSQAPAPRPVAARALARPSASAAADRSADCVLAARLTSDALDDAGSVLAFGAGGERLVVAAAEIDEALTDLRTLLREQIAPWNPTARSALLAFGASLASEHGWSRSLDEGLLQMREALRERLPLVAFAERAERVVAVERLHRVDDHAFYVKGWLWDSAAAVERLTAVSPAGERVELLERSFRHARADVAERFGVADGERPRDRCGFVCHYDTAAPVRGGSDWVFELVDATGRGVETAVAPTSTDPQSATRAIVADMALATHDVEALAETQLRPALSRLQAARRDRVEVVASESHGDPPSDPELSIVVPLYRRVDLLEHQLVQFADDPALRRCELIYVLDSPDQHELASNLARELARLYELPFRLLTLSENGGCELARAAGAGVARAPLLLFLDSDVLPLRRGWTERLIRFHAATPRIGALAPKLLYADDAIQHAGLRLERAEGATGWAPRHVFKGLHRTLPAANVARPMPAVSGACMLIDAQLYFSTQSQRWRYVQGGCEDLDLCMELAAAGHDSWYLPQVALHHLEGQSYPAAEREAYDRYNRWLLGRLHGAAIEALTA